MPCTNGQDCPIKSKIPHEQPSTSTRPFSDLPDVRHTGGSTRNQDFPTEWGRPPPIQTADIRELPGGYGLGSSTLAGWITTNMNKYHNNQSGRFPPSWGEPPRAQTKDRKPLGFGYGEGSGTLAKWIKQNIERQHGGNIPSLNMPSARLGNGKRPIRGGSRLPSGY
tara:strand:+ start:7089 stop:7586 length:498 start_codon:yes stop_codon:yes gene_type:complete